MTNDTVSAIATIKAPAEAVFAVLADLTVRGRDRRHGLGP